MNEEYIYLDYASNTPVDKDVLNTFNEITLKYFANPNSTHILGKVTNKKIQETTENIIKELSKKANLDENMEIIYTSGSSESNNLAIKGIAKSYKENGKHIISTFLEHSSVSSPLTYLKEQGYDVIGVTMQIWQDEAETVQEENGGCCGLSAVDDARRVAQVLDIPYYVMNFKKEFRENVMDYFTNEYLCGRTPNPCIACNRYVKWEALLQRSLSIGADYIATGHYARIEQLANGRYAIANSVTAAKDQTYALYNLTQEQLSHTLMPVGDYTKDQIREIAAKIGLPVAKKKDSQEICFVPDQDYASFIQNETGIVAPKGNFVNTKGEILGTHEGITHYTVGQRRGLGLPMGHRVFVLEIRPETNEVVVGENEEVFAKVVKANKVNYMAIPPLELGEELSCTAKIRYGHKGSPCVIKRTGEDEITCTFPDGVRAPTPGQAVVFYVDGCVGGGGTITEAER